MNRTQLIEFIAKQAKLTKVSASNALDGFVAAVTKTLAKGEQLTLVGFGTYKVSKRAARTGRNPQTGAVLQIKASKVPVFKAGKKLKESVQKGK